MQLSIFEIEEILEIIPFEINDNVRIVMPKRKPNDSETIYYLPRFTNKRGRVIKVVQEPLLQYHVDFDGKNAIVYHDELKYW